MNAIVDLEDKAGGRSSLDSARHAESGFIGQLGARPIQEDLQESTKAEG